MSTVIIGTLVIGSILFTTIFNIRKLIRGGSSCNGDCSHCCGCSRIDGKNKGIEIVKK